jgi:murein DD-endopeptidase MepM/ murein hydrolase activator NlpD
MKFLYLVFLVGALAIAGVFSLENFESFSRVEVVTAPQPQPANISIFKKEETSTESEAFLNEPVLEVEKNVAQEKEEIKKVLASVIKEAPTEKKEEEVSVKKLMVQINSFNLSQGQVLLVEVNSPNSENISATFLGKDLKFFSVGSKQMAFYGVDAKQAPGLYSLVVTAGAEEDIKKIAVKDANFPVTKIVVTKKLEEEGFTPENIVQSIGKNENVQLKEAMEVSQETPYFFEPFRVPLNKKVVVGNFGNIRKEGESSLQHLGVDLDAAVGDPLYAMNNGKIVFQKKLPTYGNVIIIDHGIGIFSLYLHLSEFLKSDGVEVKKGDLIGRTGNTGYSIDPHLHLSLKVYGSSVDPLEFVKVSEGLR